MFGEGELDGRRQGEEGDKGAVEGQQGWWGSTRRGLVSAGGRRRQKYDRVHLAVGVALEVR